MMNNEIIFTKRDLYLFDMDDLKKMMKIQIDSERYEGASIIRDEIEKRRSILLGKEDSENDLESD